MYGSRILRLACADLLAADTATLAQAADNNVLALVMADFAPSENILIGGITLATFDGSTPILVGLNTQPTGENPQDDSAIISLKPPAGGWRWETTGTTHLPQTIYGFALLNKALDTVLATELLPNQQTLTAINQVIELNKVHIVLPAGSLS